MENDTSIDYYELLGVPDSASAEEIKRAFFRKRKELARDVEKTTELNVAYETLSNPEKKHEYDISFIAEKQIRAVKEKGQYHQAIHIVLNESSTEENCDRVGHYICDQAEDILKSLDYIHRFAPLFWDKYKEELELLEETVRNALPYSRELNNMRNDPKISMDFKLTFELFIIGHAYPYDADKIIEELDKVTDDCIVHVERESLRKTLERIELYYPNSYRRLSDYCLGGETTAELFSESKPAESLMEQSRQYEHQSSTATDLKKYEESVDELNKLKKNKNVYLFLAIVLFFPATPVAIFCIIMWGILSDKIKAIEAKGNSQSEIFK